MGKKFKVKKFYLYSLFLLLLIPFVKADVCMPYLSIIYGVSLENLLIPTIFLEGIFAYFLLKYLYDVQVNIFYLFLTFLVANIVSTLSGMVFGMFSPCVKSVPLIYNLYFIPAYILTVLIEFPIIALFLKNKIFSTKEQITISILVNLLSYFLIFICIVILEIV